MGSAAMKSLLRVLLWAALPALTSLPAAGQSASLAPIALDRSFHAMYNLDFPLALREAAAFGKEHPEDARAQIAEASAHLFAELERLRVLQSEFFASDTGFDARNKLKPDADEKAAFDMAVDTAERKAQAALAREPKYPDASNQAFASSERLLGDLASPTSSAFAHASKCNRAAARVAAT